MRARFRIGIGNHREPEGSDDPRSDRYSYIGMNFEVEGLGSATGKQVVQETRNRILVDEEYPEQSRHERARSGNGDKEKGERKESANRFLKP